jgi:hypothetical protein
MRIDDARRGRTALSIQETWIVLGTSLSKNMARNLRQRRGRGAACETSFAVDGLPKMRNGRALARLLIQQHKRGQPRLRDVIEADMNDLAVEICQPGIDMSERALARLLERKSKVRHRRAKRTLLKRIARSVARQNASLCAHLDVGSKSSLGLTF